jgi:hypothetical protein
VRLGVGKTVGVTRRPLSALLLNSCPSFVCSSHTPSYKPEDFATVTELYEARKQAIAEPAYEMLPSEFGGGTAASSDTESVAYRSTSDMVGANEREQRMSSFSMPRVPSYHPSSSFLQGTVDGMYERLPAALELLSQVK